MSEVAPNPVRIDARKRLAGQASEASTARSGGSLEPNKRFRSSDDCIKYGFRLINGEPQCITCFRTLNNVQPSSSRLLLHLKITHPTLQDEPVSFFRQKLSALKHMTEQDILRASSPWKLVILQRKFFEAKDNIYIRHGFRVINDNLQCMICLKVLLFDSRVPAKLKRHLTMKHPYEKDECESYFVEKFVRIEKDDGNTIEEEEISDEVIFREDDPNIQFGFRQVLGKHQQCILCCKILSAEYKTPEKMKHHLESSHPGAKDKPIEFFLEKLLEVEGANLSNFRSEDHTLDSKECIRYGFRIANEKLQCVLCLRTLPIENKDNPMTLKCHLVSNHPEQQDSPVEFFQRKSFDTIQIFNLDPPYLEYGFRIVDSKPQCIFCCEFLSVDTLRPSKVSRHILAKHPYLQNEPIEFFRERLGQLETEHGQAKTRTKMEEYNRRNTHAFLKYGFRSFNGLPQCLICFKTLSAESRKPSKLARHLQARHCDIKEQTIDFFSRKLHELEMSEGIYQDSILEITQGEPDEDSANDGVASSALQIPKIEIEDTDHFMLESEMKFEEIILADPANYPQEEMEIDNADADSIAKNPGRKDKSDAYIQLKEKLKSSKLYSLQIDLQTFTDDAYVLTYVRYISDGSIGESLLFCKPLSSPMTEDNLFLIFLDSMGVYKLDWRKCIAIYTDCSKSALDKDSEFVKRVKQITTEAKWYHGLIDLHAFVIKGMPKDLFAVLEDAVNIINFVKTQTANAQLPTVLSERAGIFHQMLFLHTETRWLSRGRILNVLLGLKKEISILLTNERFSLAGVLSNPKWLLKLAYLADIFTHLNDLVESMDGKHSNVVVLQRAIEAFAKKLQILTSRLNDDHLDAFPMIWNVVEIEGAEQCVTGTKDLFLDHMNHLKSLLLEGFIPTGKFESAWISSPFTLNVVQNSFLSKVAQKQLKEISTEEYLKLAFNKVSLSQFWLSLRSRYPELARLAIQKLIPFSNTYLCELGLSSLIALKVDGKDKADIESELMFHINSSIMRIV